MLTIEQTKGLLSKDSTLLTQEELLQIIQRYLYDKKGLNTNVLPPRDIIEAQMLHIAHISAFNHYMSLE